MSLCISQLATRLRFENEFYFFLHSTKGLYTGHLSTTCIMYWMNIFLDKWSPALQIRTVLLSIQALLSAPNPDDPLANDVAEQWKINESMAIETGEHLHTTDSLIHFNRV